jgi:hypothetical protein
MDVIWMFRPHFHEQEGCRSQPSSSAELSVLWLTGQLSSYHPHVSAGADKRVRTCLIVDGHDRELSFWLPVEGEVEVAREDRPSRTVIQFDDDGSQNGTGSSWRVFASAGSTSSSDRLLLPGRGPGVRLVRVGLVSVMADDATGRSAELAVTRPVAGGTTDDGALSLSPPRPGPKRLRSRPRRPLQTSIS